jgi:NAD(P)-dependent dehydrogenase (short-subunit alcohol dehydrogenase family)
MTQRKAAFVTLAEQHGSPAVALHLAAAGYDLFLQSQDEDVLRKELEGSGVRVLRSTEDLLTPESAQRAVQAALDAFGHIDAAWVRTGLTSKIGGRFLDSDASLWDKLKRHDIDRLVYVLQALLPSMVAAGAGQVVVSTSAAGVQPMANTTLYGASRAAAISLVRGVGLELASTGVTINAIATAFFDVPVFRAATGADTPEGRKKVEAMVPMGRLGSTEEFAELAMMLLDGRNRFQTGQCFSFSGGWSP